MCLAQGPQAVTPVRLVSAALRSRVKHSTTEPLRSQLLLELMNQVLQNFIVSNWAEDSISANRLKHKIIIIFNHPQPFSGAKEYLMEI